MAVVQCTIPLVSVMSESMEPAYQVGDLLLVHGYEHEYQQGEVIIFKAPHQSMKIVHRIVETEPHIITKGDNNHWNDAEGSLYHADRPWVDQEDIHGTVYARIPLIGYPSMLCRGHPYVVAIAVVAYCFFIYQRRTTA